MTRFRIPILVLAVLQMVLAGFTALVGAFADGGDVGSRLLLVAVHPLAAVGMLLVLSLPRPATSLVVAVAVILLVNVAADLSVALMIAVGLVKGDWWLLPIFAVIPAVGLAYALNLLRARTAKATAG